MNRISTRTAPGMPCRSGPVARVAGLLLAVSALLGCDEALDIPAPVTAALTKGESRTLELRATRLEVQRFEKTLDRDELLKLPPSLREQVWLLNLDLSGTSAAPKLFDAAIDALRSRDVNSTDLSTEEANLVRLLQMTPATAELAGTSLAPLLQLAEQLGFDPGVLLAEAMDIPTTEPFLATEDIKWAMLNGVVASHPNAATRPGRVDADHPDGRWPVPVGSLPVTLEDVLSDMRTLAAKFGPHAAGGHPGFLVGDTSGRLLTDEFTLTVQVQLNALPYKGVDLSQASVASVNSIGAEPDGMFDFSTEDWLQMDGLEPGGPVVSELRFALLDVPAIATKATTPVPWPTGDGSVWSFPAWSLESVVANAAVRRWGHRNATLAYALGANPTPVATMELVDGWLTAQTPAELGSPPAPTYLWDVLLEVAHARLREGSALAETEPLGLAFSLFELPVGFDNDAIEADVRANLRVDQSGLVSAARFLFDNGYGEPDFFYLRVTDGPSGERGNYLAWVVEFDVPLDGDGRPVRRVEDYAHPGFFADAALEQPLHAPRSLRGGPTRPMVRIRPGDVLFVADDADDRFRLDIQDEPGANRCAVKVTRL